MATPGKPATPPARPRVIGLTRTMAKEWGRYNVNVNCVGFGLIETRLTHPLTPDAQAIEIKGHPIVVGVQPKMLESR